MAHQARMSQALLRSAVRRQTETRRLIAADGWQAAGRARYLCAAGRGASLYRFDELFTTNHLGLPRLPIPDLNDTLDRYLESLSPVTEPEALEAHRKLVEAFRVTEGPVLQTQLLEADRQLAAYPYSYIEKYWDDMYLELRCPLSVHVAPGYGLRPDADCGTDRALRRLAKFTAATFRWQHKSLSGEMEPDVRTLGCMSFLARVLGTARVPKPARDQLRFSPASTHVAVVREGRIFRVDVLSKDRCTMLSIDALQKQLEHIMQTAGVPSKNAVAGLGLGLLTREDRDLWAGLRSGLEAQAENYRSLADIDSALFVICLDQHEPTSATQRSQDLLHGRPGRLDNRWFDKMQVIWSPSGTISVCFEHTYSDGIVWNRWLGDVWSDMQASPSAFSPLPSIPETSHIASPRELTFEVTDEVKQALCAARDRAEALVSSVATQKVEVEGVGKANFKAWGLSPDATVQMALQLAYFRLHGRIAPTYESCSTKAFFHGRTEVIRSAHSAGAEFCRGVAQQAAAVRPGYIPMSRDAQVALLKTATKQQMHLSKLAVQGLGVDRHLYSLQKLSMGILPTSPSLQPSDTSKLPDMFLDAPYSQASTWRLSTSNPSAAWNEVFNFGPVCADGYGVGYLVHHDQLLFNVTAFKTSNETDADELANAIRDSLTSIRTLMGP